MQFSRSIALAALTFAALGCALRGPSGGTVIAHHAEHSSAERPDPSYGFLVLAPDRGFLGNEEVREAFAALAREQNAALVIVTDQRTRRQLEAAVSELRARGANRVVAMPLFITESHPRWLLVRRLLAEAASSGIQIARRFGSSYLGVEVLADHFRQVVDPSGRRVVVVGYGASDEQTRLRMTTELTPIADAAAAGFGFEDVRVVVWHELSGAPPVELAQHSRAALRDAVSGGDRSVVVPFHVGKKLDGMMTFNGELRRGELPEGVDLIDTDITPHAAVAMWMRREANRHVLSAQDVGVVVLAHGSDFHWNDTMRTALRSLTEKYPTEFAFCMADQPIMERAVRRLESRGARGIVIVRVFGMASSFRRSVERMIGMDIEQGEHHDLGLRGSGRHGHQSLGHAQVHGAVAAEPPRRIRSAAVITTLGGLEDHALFADALAARARELSRDPARETVILVAHGLGDDAQDDHWVSVLDSLADQMRANGGGDFRDIHVATWREDWPEKRAPSVARVRELVQAASREGYALVIPARTNAQGPERELLDGLDFQLGEGFAPHALFARWVEDQILQGQARLLAGDQAVLIPNDPVDPGPAPARLCPLLK